MEAPPAFVEPTNAVALPVVLISKYSTGSTPTPNLDENSGVLVEGFLEISDPETGEIILQRRD